MVEVDCATNPLVCELRGPVVDDLEEEYTANVVHAATPEVDGYPQFYYSHPLMPADIYDKQSLRVVDGEITLDKWTVVRETS